MKIKFAKNVALINFSQKPFFQNFFQNTKKFFFIPGGKHTASVFTPCFQ